jgi:hypothetical protein
MIKVLTRSFKETVSPSTIIWMDRWKTVSELMSISRENIEAMKGRFIVFFFVNKETIKNAISRLLDKGLILL